MKSNLVYLRPLRVAYVRSTGSYAQSGKVAWTQLFDWLNQNGLNAFPGCGYGLLLDNHLATPDTQCRYDACVEISSLPENRAEGCLQVRKLPGGAYVRERFVGCYKKMHEQTLAVRHGWSHESGLILDERRPLVQIYLDDPRRSLASELRSDICVPVIAEMAMSAAEADGSAD